MKEKVPETDILINGAGPTGLMMACQLALHQIPFRIIEKKIKSDNYSGAMIIHSRSLEILHQMGLSLKFLREGIIARKINFQFNYRKHFSIDVADFGNGWSLFPYILILEQTKIEKLLRSFLIEKGYTVEDGTTLLSFTQKKGIVTSVLKKPDGLGEIINSKYLIGAGGSTSLVRRQLKIPFYGITHPDLLFVSDSEMEMPAPQAEMLFTFAKHQTLGFFPLPNNRWRIDGAIPGLSKNTDKVDFDFVESYLSNNSNLNLQLLNSTWFSVFRSHSRYAPATKHHHCFLVGDAAHIHSPVGAQGMNTGLQDACNLAWKLALFLKGNARQTILETYEEERLPVAKNIIRYTDNFYLWITDNRNFFKYLRLFFLPVLIKSFIFLIMKFKAARKYVFMSVSGVGINYRRSSISGYYHEKRLIDTYPLPGDLLPCVQYFIGSRIYNFQEKITSTSYHLFVFGVLDIPEDILNVIGKFKQVVKIELVPSVPGTEEVYKTMVKHQQACYLVRPDMYIAWKSDSLDARSLERYLHKFLVPQYAFQEA